MLLKLLSSNLWR